MTGNMQSGFNMIPGDILASIGQDSPSVVSPTPFAGIGPSASQPIDSIERLTPPVRPGREQPAEAPPDPGPDSTDESGTVAEAPDDPHRLARAVFAQYAHDDGSTLAHYRDHFYVHDGAVYRLVPDIRPAMVKMVKDVLDKQYREAMRALPQQLRHGALVGSRGRPASAEKTVPKVTSGLIRDVIQALIPMVMIASEEQAPGWRSSLPDDPDPTLIIPAANGLVFLDRTGPRIMAHTPRFFSTQVLPYAFDPQAPPPELWLKFLGELWPDDPESIESLHEVMGYLLTPDTSLQKMFLFIGPPASGRSTIKEIITRLVGEQNVASTSATAMNSPFGLEPLVGKSVAIFSDLRVGRDNTVMLDRLLRITGCDPVEVNGKYKSIRANERMPIRFVCLSNELPGIADASNAITRRYHILETPKVIPEDRRDPHLAAKLTRELSGILNLAIEGRARLYNRGRFVQPNSAADLIETAREIASPVRECVAECFTVREGAWVTKIEAYRLWRPWAESRGENPGSNATFGKSLLAAVPGVKSGRRRMDGRQVPIYEGIEGQAIPTGRTIEA